MPHIAFLTVNDSSLDGYKYNVQRKTGVEVPNHYSITASMLLPESLVGFLTAC